MPPRRSLARFSAAQKNHLDTILRNLCASKRRVTSAKLADGDTRRLYAAVDSLIGDVEQLLKSGRTTG